MTTIGDTVGIRLDGRIALVTGGAGSIGGAIAAALLGAGCKVYLGDVRIEAALDRAEALGEGARAVPLDVTNAGNVSEALHRIEAEAGGLDILVNNAGIITCGALAQASFADWDAVCAVNLTGVYYCSKAAMPALMRSRHGRIVNIASIAGAKGGGLIGNTLYGATKAGVIALTKGFARELAPHGITVNAIGPSVVETPMTEPYLTPDVRERLTASIPAGRFATTDDVAALALFLASDAAAYINGETIFVDGALLKR